MFLNENSRLFIRSDMIVRDPYDNSTYNSTASPTPTESNSNRLIAIFSIFGVPMLVIAFVLILYCLNVSRDIKCRNSHEESSGELEDIVMAQFYEDNVNSVPYIRSHRRHGPRIHSENIDQLLSADRNRNRAYGGAQDEETYLPNYTRKANKLQDQGYFDNKGDYFDIEECPPGLAHVRPPSFHEEDMFRGKDATYSEAPHSQ